MSQKRRTSTDEPFMLVRTSTSDLSDGARIAPHAHEWHQLIYVGSGLATVRTTAGSWIAPPTWAVWVPADVEHSIRFVGGSALRTVYVRPAWCADVPATCAALGVSPLLRELILRATTIGMLDGRIRSEAAIAGLIVDELGKGGPPPFTLPEPSSAAMIAAARLAGDRTSRMSIAAIAREVGLATRSLERRFFLETGMTFGRWRQQRMLLRGLEQVASGASIKAASALAGYTSSSSYIAAFRKAFATTPGRYF
jgi:AraC-like DNA-binding protein